MEPETDALIARVLGDLAIEMHAQADPDSTLRTIVTAAMNIVPGINWAGVCVLYQHRLQAAMPGDSIAGELDRLQIELAEGPALDALVGAHSVVVDDLCTETRWPDFTPAALSRGVRCLLAFRLAVDDQKALGALTLYGPQPTTLSEDSGLVGEILAQHAAVAMAGAQTEEQLQRAVASRDLIGQAKGILMCREQLTSMQAFALLTKTSQETNIKLTDVARFLVTDFEKNLPRPSAS